MHMIIEAMINSAALGTIMESNVIILVFTDKKKTDVCSRHCVRMVILGIIMVKNSKKSP